MGRDSSAYRLATDINNCRVNHTETGLSWRINGWRPALAAPGQLLGILLLGAIGDMFALVTYHGLAFLPAPDAGVFCFGWPFLLAGLAIWAFALAYSRAPLFAARFSRGRLSSNTLKSV